MRFLILRPLVHRNGEGARAGCGSALGHGILSAFVLLTIAERDLIRFDRPTLTERVSDTIANGFVAGWKFLPKSILFSGHWFFTLRFCSHFLGQCSRQLDTLFGVVGKCLRKPD